MARQSAIVVMLARLVAVWLAVAERVRVVGAVWLAVTLSSYRVVAVWLAQRDSLNTLALA
jgi:hypothetical protein